MDVACTSPPLVFHFRAGTVASMNKTVIEVQVRAVLPTSGGCAVFIGNNEKVFIIYVDQTVGSAITMFMRQITKERPLTPRFDGTFDDGPRRKSRSSDHQ